MGTHPMARWLGTMLLLVGTMSPTAAAGIDRDQQGRIRTLVDMLASKNPAPTDEPDLTFSMNYNKEAQAVVSPTRQRGPC